MLAAEVPADVHQLDRIERAAPAPRLAGGVRALALERVLDRDEPVPAPCAPGDAEIVADVREQHDVDVLEHAGAHEVRLAAEELFGDAGPELQRAGKLFALHDLLHRERRGDVERHARSCGLRRARARPRRSDRDKRRRASATPAECQSMSEPSAITGLPDPTSPSMRSACRRRRARS